MERIAQSENLQTQCIWSLAAPTSDCPNWIARWFLYHKFRYRDRRNRNHAKSSGTEKHHHHQSEEHEDYYGHEPHDLKESMTSGVYTLNSLPLLPLPWIYDACLRH
jgi:hypothetical protein